MTGSGKTEIYLQLADHVRRQQRQSLLLVPEIALTPALAGRVRARFGERVAIQHSGLSDGERHDQWHRVRGGDVDVVVGTRSAVFAPLDRLGLVVVDEEHDTLVQAGREPALSRPRRRRDARAPGRGARRPRLGDAVAGDVPQRARPAATPWCRWRAGSPTARWPTVRVVNMRDEWAEAGEEVIVSRLLAAAMTARLDAGEQSLVLLNRRGIAAAVLCRQCGSTVECPHCSVSMTVHGSGARAVARCHYCDFSQRGPAGLPELRGAVPRARRLRHRAGRGRSAGALSVGARSAASTVTPCGAAAAWPRCWRASRGASSTCSSAPR